MPAKYLVDTSALARKDRLRVDERLRGVLAEKAAALCGVVELEILYAARDPADMVERQREMAEIFAHVDTIEADFTRAKELMRELAARGKHRAAGVADLLIASCAGRAGLTLLHYDSDFDTIAGITGQSVEWIVPRGSVP